LDPDKFDSEAEKQHQEEVTKDIESLLSCIS